MKNFSPLELCITSNLQQVVATVDETNPLAKLTEIRENGLDNDLAAHINSKMADLALSSAEKQVNVELKTRHT